MDFVSAAKEARRRRNCTVWRLASGGYIAATDEEAQKRSESGQSLTEIRDWRRQLKSYAG